VGAVRLRYADDPDNQRAAQRIAGDARRKIMKLLEPILREPEKYMSEIEGALAAMLSCIVACTLAADNTWEETLITAVRLIGRLGGAQKVVALSLKDQYSVTRFVLEQLAVRDVIACMTLGRRPSIIRQPFEPWFFEIERWSGREVEWESVERLFGKSAVMSWEVADTRRHSRHGRRDGTRVLSHRHSARDAGAAECRRTARPAAPAPGRR
jgi:hypothetical protein